MESDDVAVDRLVAALDALGEGDVCRADARQEAIDKLGGSAAYRA